nr:MAG TPA: Hint (Hedgehog/Intein) domain N-terminal region [Caudoviricetes sp.]
MINIDLTTLSGYESLAAGTYQLAVRAKAAGYQDSDLSSTVSFTKLAAPVATASDTTVTWEAVANAESYDMYVDGELYENTTGGGVTEYTATVKVNGSCDAANCPIKLYDGNDANGTLLTTINENPSVGEVGTFSIKSGSLYIQAHNYTGIVGAWYQVNVNTETGDAITFTTKTEVVPISSNVIITFADMYCLTGDTLITLADGSSKRIDQLTLADKVLSYNPDTMLLEPDEITYTDSAEHKTHTEYKNYTFEDGTTVKTVHRHRFYNVERQAMIYMDEWKIGEHAVNIHGEIVALANEITCKTEIRHYTIFTKNQNYFANGLLSGNRYTKPLTL